jgi:hypothetical protein
VRIFSVNAGTELDTKSWLAALSIGIGDSWTEIQGSSVVVDLSSTLSVDFATLAEIVLAVERFLKNQNFVQVSLPAPRETARETRLRQSGSDESRDRLTGLLARRRSIYNFLDSSGFLRSVRCSHRPESSHRFTMIVAEEPRRDAVRAKAPSASNARNTRTIRERPADRSLFPLAWFPPLGTESLEHWVEEASSIIRRRGSNGSVPPDLADSIADVILSELVENVFDHSSGGEEEPNWALVGVFAYIVRETGYLPPMPAGLFTKYSLQEVSTGDVIVRVVVGDGGVGIPASLTSRFIENGNVAAGDRHVVKWALTPESTSRDSKNPEEPRGLAAVDKYCKVLGGSIRVKSGSGILTRAFSTVSEETAWTRIPIPLFGTLLDVCSYLGCDSLSQRKQSHRRICFT